MLNTSIDNRLEYIVRDIFHQEYAQLAIAVLAVFGVQMIEPFNAPIVNKNSSHKRVQILSKELYHQRLKQIDKDFFLLEKPCYP